MTIWATLLLRLNPVTLDASQRIRLASAMADYLRLPLGFVYLFSRRNPFIQQQEKLRVCRQGGQGASRDVAELLWPAGCQGEERQSDLVKVLEYSVKAGGLARLLKAPVLGWRVLCAPGGLRRKVKRDLQRLKFTPTPYMIVPLPTQAHPTLKLEHSHIYSLPLTKLEPSLSAILLHMNHIGTQTEDFTDSTVISGGKEVLFQPSCTQGETFPGSTEKAFKFTSNMDAFKMYHSDINPEMPVAISETDHMQKVQVSSISPFSIKQNILYPYSRDVSVVLERQVFNGEIISTPMHTLVCAAFGCSHSNRFSVHNSQRHIRQAGLSASKIKPPVEATGCSEQVSEVTWDTSLSISEYFWTTELFPLSLLSEDMSTVRTLVGEPSADTALSTFSPSSTLRRIHSSLPLTPTSYSVTSTVTHEAVDRKPLATRLTLRPQPKETPLWTGSYRAGRTDSESQPTVSLGKSAAVDSYMTIWDCSGRLVIQDICSNDLTLFEREPTAEWS